MKNIIVPLLLLMLYSPAMAAGSSAPLRFANTRHFAKL
jgi:uncharacterized membrane protein YfcA